METPIPDNPIGDLQIFFQKNGLGLPRYEFETSEKNFRSFIGLEPNHKVFQKIIDGLQANSKTDKIAYDGKTLTFYSTWFTNKKDAKKDVAILILESIDPIANSIYTNRPASSHEINNPQLLEMMYFWNKNKLRQLKELFDLPADNEKLDCYLMEAFLHDSFGSGSDNFQKNVKERFKLHSFGYRRLETLGDSVLGMVICRKLFDDPKTFNSGEITRLRSCLVNGEAMTRIAKKRDLKQFILSGTDINDRIMGDVVEAFVGAVYLSCPWELTVRFTEELCQSEFDALRK